MNEGLALTRKKKGIFQACSRFHHKPKKTEVFHYKIKYRMLYQIYSSKKIILMATRKNTRDKVWSQG